MEIKVGPGAGPEFNDTPLAHIGVHPEFFIWVDGGRGGGGSLTVELYII